MCYVSIAVITDYDVWHAAQEAVSADGVLQTMAATVDQAQRLVAAALPDLDTRSECSCRQALSGAIATPRSARDPVLLADLAPLLDRYLRAEQ
jgi:5'-methylthioadenosine phosphorylase